MVAERAAVAQGGGPLGRDDAAPADGAAVRVVEEFTDEGVAHALVLSGNDVGPTGGPTGTFYRTRHEIRNARVMQFPAAAVPIPATPENPNPRQPTPPVRFTTIVLWNELHSLRDDRGNYLPGEDGKLHPYKAIRLGGTARFPDPSGPGGGGGPGVPPGEWEEPGEGTWNHGDADSNGTFDAGFVLIGETDYRIMLRYAEFNPVGLTSPGGAGVPPAFPELEPWRVGEPILPEGLSARDVPAYDVDGDGVVDPTGFGGGGCHLYIVQFWTQALEEYRQSVVRAGGEGTTIYQFMPHNAYVVYLPSQESHDAVAGLSCVRSVIPYHPAYRLDDELVARYFGRDGAVPTEPPVDNEPPVRYNIQVLERGERQKQIVARRVEEVGGRINELYRDGLRLMCTLSIPQLAVVLFADEVTYLDAWGEPGSDMDIVREIGGATYLATSPLGYTGAGVSGEVMDNYLYLEHAAFQSPLRLLHGVVDPLPIATNQTFHHGTLSYGIIFGNGTGNAMATGMLPASQGIFASRLYLTNRYAHIAELVNPSLSYKAVFQSNSWGGPITTAYTTTSAMMDDILFINDILICQSQSNAGSTLSRPEAWAKNIVSVGGIKHLGCDPEDPDPDCQVVRDTNRDDDCWAGCLLSSGLIASTGPAADGRIKPDLSHFGDHVFTADFDYNPCGEQDPCLPPCDGLPTFCAAPRFTSGDGEHGSTSAATPITAGHFGLFFQMWHEEVFAGFGGGASAFADRPHMSTAKAMLINTAFRYDWGSNAPIANQDITRVRQGWGMANLHDSAGTGLYDMRERLFIVNETTLLTSPGSMATYFVTVDGVYPLRATLVYTDPPGTTSAKLHRINDLSLFVTAPDGTGYWGNRGLTNANWSVAGGGYDTVNTVENVFIQTPAAGTWRVDVICHVLAADSHTETLATEADFALVVSGLVPVAVRAPDWNKDGEISGADFVAFLNDFMNGIADVDHDGATSSEDVFAFINALFTAPTPTLNKNKTGGGK